MISKMSVLVNYSFFLINKNVNRAINSKNIVVIKDWISTIDNSKRGIKNINIR